MKAAGTGYLMNLPLIALGETLQGAPWDHIPPFRWGTETLFIATNRVGICPMGFPLIGLGAMIACVAGLGLGRDRGEPGPQPVTTEATVVFPAC